MGKIRSIWKNIARRTNYIWHRRKLKSIHPISDTQYSEYLDLQVSRTVSQKQNNPPLRAPMFMEEVVKSAPNAKSALCIGCRTTRELDFFNDHGFETVKGIDLVSERQDILIMDMHEMTFPDSSFEVIFASHSLEHAYAPEKVMSEIIRVAKPNALIAIEVPIEFEPRGSDLVNFGDADTLHGYFSGYIQEIVMSNTYLPKTDNNLGGNTILRTLFRIVK